MNLATSLTATGLLFSTATSLLAQALPKLPPPGEIPVAEYAQRTVVIYNTMVPDSKKLAEYYATKRGIPAGNLVGLETSPDETIVRSTFNSSILEPLRKKFTDNNWWKIQDTPQGKMAVTAERRVIAIMTGVPLRILPVTKKEKNPDTGKLEDVPNTAMGENAASVDAELAALGVYGNKLDGPLNNFYFEKDALFFTLPLAPIYLVGRIDGPTYKDCQRLVDDAVATEKSGLYGRAYIDLAQKTQPGYKQGEDWLLASAKRLSDFGMPTIVDMKPETLPLNYPMPDAAIYLGWYTLPADGPFLNPTFRFRKGAVACHIHSFSATSVRNPAEGYVAPFVTRGAAAVPGNVFEPYLGLTIHLDILMDRLLKGYTLAEASAMATPGLSWMSVMVGDPLYRPFIAKSTPNPTDEAYATLRRLLKMNAASGNKDQRMLVERIASLADKSKQPAIYEAAALYSMGVLKEKDRQISEWFDAAASAAKDDITEVLHQRFTQSTYLSVVGEADKAKKVAQAAIKSYPDAPGAKAFEALVK